MNNWEEIQLGELLEIKHGWAFKGEFFSSEGDLIVVTPGNFIEQGGFRVRDGKEKFYLGEFPGEHLLKKDDVIIAMTEQGPGLLGSPGLIPSDNKFLHNQRIGLISKIKSARISNKFIYYLFFTHEVRNEIFGSATGTKVKHTAPKRIYKIKVKLPSLLIQHRIASILSGYDDLIENNLKRIKLLEELAQRTYEEWFVKFCINEKQLRVDQKTGLPEGWGKSKLNEVARVNAKSIKKSFEGRIKYVDISSVSTGRIEFFTEYDIADAPGRARRILSQGDIIWSCVRPNRKSYSIVWNPEDNLIGSTGFAVITPVDLPASYLYQFLTTDAFVGYLSNRASGAAYPAVTSEVFENAEVIIPPQTLVKLFDDKFKPCIDLISNMAKQNKLLKEARDILLPRLMSGEIDVDRVQEENLAIAAESRANYKKARNEL